MVGLFMGQQFADLINPRKKMFGVVILPVYFGRDLFCYSNFNVFYINNKEAKSLIARCSHSNL